MRQRGTTTATQLPLLEQPSVQAKMRKFHSQVKKALLATPPLRFNVDRGDIVFSAKVLTFICNFRLSVYTQSEHLLSTYVDCIMIL